MNTLDSFFYPESVALVGVPRGMKAGRLFLQALINCGFKGPIYPINPQADEIDGYKAYPGMASIPGPVDLAILLTPHHQIEAVLRECSRKGTRAAIVYTAGYSELGTEEGRLREERLVALAREEGIRIIGPNCMGIYHPGHGLSFFPPLTKTPGRLGFISQSGSLANMICSVAPESSIYFSKAISSGNECDLTCADFLDYLGRDPDTDCVGMYLEGLKQGSTFLSVLKDVCARKPVVIWKAGLTEDGMKAAASHTGSMAGAEMLWRAVFQQTGAISVTGLEEMLDVLIASYLLPRKLGKKVAFITGQGGLAVASADACCRNRLELATFAPLTRQRIADRLNASGSSTNNPVDVGLAGAMDLESYSGIIREVAADPSVDGIFVFGVAYNQERGRQYVRSLIEVKNASGKPIINVATPLFPPEFSASILMAGISAFSSVERAMNAYGKIWRFRQSQALRAGWKRIPEATNSAVGLEKRKML